MPNYGTVDGVVDLYLRVGSLTTIPSAVIERFINRAENLINVRLAHLYTIPLTCNPPLLADLCEELATAFILRRQHTQEKENVSEWVAAYFERVNEVLEPISSGSFSLVCSSGVFIDEDRLTTAPWSNTSEYKPTFDLRRPIFQRIDPDRLDDIWDQDRDTDGTRFLN